MRLRKSGDAAISREEWNIYSYAHRKFAAELISLLDDFVPRGERSEARPTEAAPPTIDRTRAFYELTRELLELVNKYQSVATACDELAQRVRRGRPISPRKGKVVTNALLAVLPGQSWQAKRPPGRPRQTVDASDLQTYLAVQRRRSELRTGALTSIKEAIESLIEDIARATGSSVARARQEHAGKLKAQYYRGKLRVGGS